MEIPPENPPPVIRSNWPTTLGIISIIFGIFGFLYSASQVANAVMMKSIGPAMMVPPSITGTSGATEEQKAMEEAMGTAMTEMMTHMAEIGKTKIWVDGGVMILGIIQFVGGILLLQRYRISKPILLGWSYGKLVIGLWSVFLTQKMISGMGGSMGAMMDEQINSASGGSGPPPFDMVKMYEIMGLVFLVFGALWLAVLPVIFLIWFNRQEIKEDMISDYGWK